MVYTLLFFLSLKCSSFHNSNLFGSVLFTFYIQSVLKLKKIIPAPKGSVSDTWAPHSVADDTLCLFQRQYVMVRGTAVVQWLRCCATNRKVAGSIPDGVIGIFH